MASSDDFARLASVLGEQPRTRSARTIPPETASTPAPPKSGPKLKKKRPEPDRSRDHAVYLAPHRPPAKSIPPIDASTLRSVPREALVELAEDLAQPKQRGAYRAAAFGAVAAILVAVAGASAFFAIVRHF